MTVGNNPTDRSKLGTKRHVLTDKNGIPLSVVISSANAYDIKLVTDVVDNRVIKRPSLKLKKQEEEEEKNFNIYVLIKHIIPNKKNKN
ncbi:MAG TPA: transposase [Candidatus Nitrosocosmicus sp.]